MKQVRNRRTGDVGELDFDSKEGVFIVVYYDLNIKEYVKHFYRGIKGLSAEWEDVPEEPFSTPFYTIVDGKIKHCIFYRERIAGCPSDAWAYLKDDGRKSIEQLKEVGLYFETEEEAKKAVEKLKAWKRLKDKGFSIYSWDYEFDIVDKPAQTIILRASAVDSSNTDLDLLFGGEE